jgi:uncharacterized RDD family membrane protein YckC
VAVDASQHPVANAAQPTATLPAKAEAQPVSSPTPLWMRRLGAILFILFCIELGILALALPWTHAWSDNSFFLAYPRIRMWLNGGFPRGIVSGFGILCLYIGIWEAAHYRESHSALH